MGRFQMNVPDERLEDLRVLKKECGLTTLASVVNSALSIFEWIVIKRKQGWQIVAMKEKNGVVTTQELVMPCLPKISSD